MRLFDEHIIRKTRLLDGMWDFATDEKEVGLKEEWFKNFPEKSMQVNVPGCINNRLGFIEFQKTCNTAILRHFINQEASLWGREERL